MKIFNAILKTRLFLTKYANGKNVLISLIITQVIYFVMVLYTIPNLMSYAGGMNILDMISLGYKPEYVKSLLEQLGPIGRDYYLYTQLPLDMIYPLLFAVTYSLLLIYLFSKIFNHSSKIQLLALIPILAGLFDYFENLGIITMLIIFPIFSETIAEITNVFSIIKSISTTSFFMLLIFGIAVLLFQKFKVNKN